MMGQLAAVEERRAALSELVRAHGSLDEAIALLDTGSARLAELDDDGERGVFVDVLLRCFEQNALVSGLFRESTAVQTG